VQAREQTSSATTALKTVVFVDVLGFASLTEQHALELEQIKAAEYPLSIENINMRLRRGENPLTQIFTKFHGSLKAAIDLAKMQHPLDAITFSDSAFIATAHLYDAASIAIRLMHYLLAARVPVRVGIGHGSFSALRFRSDVTLEGGDHAAHFLGTGLVRSNAAEGCGIKGLRILMHPSAMRHLGELTKGGFELPKESIRIIKCSADETNNPVAVQCEVDYWRFAVTAEAEAWRALQDMWSAAPEEEMKHYEATARAIDRMRVQQGHEPLANLRRRTLPRKPQSAV
jgi:hypothetical protein